MGEMDVLVTPSHHFSTAHSIRIRGKAIVSSL
jgi:hypothetical protein